MTFDIFQPWMNDYENYFIVEYFLQSTINLADAAWNLAIGQSIGNPSQRSSYETEEIFQNHSCIVLHDKSELEQYTSGIVRIAFPIKNIDFKTDGVSHLLSNIMGGQLDIDTITQCHIKDIIFPTKVKQCFPFPKYGIEGIRKYTKSIDKPLIGGIIKPKTGLSKEVLLDMVKELVDGGVNFIKEDEILSGGYPFCPLEERVPYIADFIQGKNVIYCFSITGDPLQVIERAKFVANNGGNGIHINFWSGLGIYKNIRELDLPLFMHFQKSGDKILTSKNHQFHINWKVICKLATMMGVDFIHAGMFGGYSTEKEETLKEILDVLQKGKTMPALSCGLHPGLVKAITKRFGNDLLLNSGGSLYSHPLGTKAGVQAFKQAINDETDKLEYQEAIKKWGKLD